LDLPGIDWVIVGGESGPGARPMELDWARSIRDQCAGAAVPFFLKQLGGVVNKRGHDLAVLDGQLWRAMPLDRQERDEVAVVEPVVL
jgi:protein gp37